MTRMAALGPKASALIASGRKAYRPQQADRERIEAALRVRLGADALPHDANPSPLHQLSTWKLLSGAAFGLFLGGSAALWALDPSHAPQPRAALVRRAALAQHVTEATKLQPKLEQHAVTPEPAAALTPAETKQPRSPAASRVDPLSQEVSLLTRATREIGAGHPAKALQALTEHQQRFPNGKLSEERRAAKAQALCALGRVAEGRAEQRQLVQQSPTAARAKQACDAAAHAGGTTP